jgi:micrococcal nuclease
MGTDRFAGLAGKRERSGEVNPNYTYKATLIRVVDGDTIEVMADLGFSVWHRCTLRLDGVDTPERHEAGYREAFLATRDFCGTGSGELVIQTRPDPRRRVDGFRRYLARVWVDGVPQELGEFLLAQHHAVPWVKGGAK